MTAAGYCDALARADLIERVAWAHRNRTALSETATLPGVCALCNVVLPWSYHVTDMRGGKTAAYSVRPKSPEETTALLLKEQVAPELLWVHPVRFCACALVDDVQLAAAQLNANLAKTPKAAPGVTTEETGETRGGRQSAAAVDGPPRYRKVVTMPPAVPAGSTAERLAQQIAATTTTRLPANKGVRNPYGATDE